MASAWATLQRKKERAAIDRADDLVYLWREHLRGKPAASISMILHNRGLTDENGRITPKGIRTAAAIHNARTVGAFYDREDD